MDIFYELITLAHYQVYMIMMKFSKVKVVDTIFQNCTLLQKHTD